MSNTFGVLDVRYKNHEAIALPDGGELYYEDSGEGAPLTFINNFYILSPVWGNFTQDLAKEFRLINYDLRNQGASSPGPNPTTFDDHVEDLRRLLDHRGIEKTYLVATSISTLIAREFTYKYPERVAGLVLIGPAFSPNGTLRRILLSKHWLATLEHGGTTALFDMLYPLVFPDQLVHAGGKPAYLALRDNFMSLLSKTGIADSLKASLDVDDDPEKLSTLTQPTLLINGDGDFAWSRSVIEDALQRIPNSQEVTLARAGHVPFFDDPDGFQKATAEFVRGCEAARSEDGAREPAAA
ncbi:MULTISPECIES: alpha/beta fold hydrolase [unclassified Streptomyces]|uniref:alpha/beta fold hydrolase n=1 Tax=unclassified Streptomyces TaxID=2593676 RepID=UPI001368A398|nr:MULTISPECIES: alpha/beta hydrolase [unclassified Streptomyces]MCW5253069.1 alpha/beta hydrolase [Streptomyces sp. SHP 1-2]MYU20830.1 alpha/beta fold hydrolase [Streptomyces sp. SID8352]